MTIKIISLSLKHLWYVPSTRQPGEVSIHIRHPICYGTYSNSDAGEKAKNVTFWQRRSFFVFSEASLAFGLVHPQLPWLRLNFSVVKNDIMPHTRRRLAHLRHMTPVRGHLVSRFLAPVVESTTLEAGNVMKQQIPTTYKNLGGSSMNWHRGGKVFQLDLGWI